MVATTWNKGFCDNHAKQPLIHLETTNMEVLDLTSWIPQALAIILNPFEFWNSLSFTFPHLQTPSFESNHIFTSFLVDLHANTLDAGQ